MKLRDVNPQQPVLAEQQLDEINMSPSSLKQLASRINARAGMEFEMIVPNAQNDEGGDLEPDYDSDQRTRSFGDIEEFFHDGDYNGRREVQRLIEQLRERYYEWEIEKIDNDWGNDGEDYLRDWIHNNEWDEEEKIREHLESQGLGEDEIEAAMSAGNSAPRYSKLDVQQAAREADENYDRYMEAKSAADDEFEELVTSEWEGRGNMYDSALDEYREENQGTADEDDFLDDSGLRYMSDISNEFDISWPYWQSQGGGEVSAEEVASDFADAVGRSVKASGSYHSGGVERPGANNSHYIVEPDGSLEADDSNDAGLEFVSPALPIAELLSDLDKVAKWAGRYGCYTNDSTGLHINVSVEGWSGDVGKLDYVKLALLLGDNYILDKFGRAGNTYCKSAMNEIKNRVSQRPEDAGALLQKMKTGLDGLASKAIHSGVTSKYTSINTKDGYIEFRSPGGDWLGEYASDPGSITNTLLRFVVALDAAVDPEKYKQEYLKKLYAILQPKTHNDTLAYFAQYAAGAMPKAALKSFVRQAQLERKSKKGGDAKAYTTIPSTGNQKYEIQRATDNETVVSFNADSDSDANIVARQWLADNGLERADFRLNRAVGQERAEASSSTTGTGEWTGQWLIKDGSDRVLHSFGGIGNNQSDANRFAIQWLTRNGYGHGTEVSVVPEMR
jgi:hypothetical protein